MASLFIYAGTFQRKAANLDETLVLRAARQTHEQLEEAVAHSR